MLPSPSRLRPLDTDFGLPSARPELRLVPRENRVAVLLNANAKRVNARVRDAFAQVVPEEDLFFSRSLDEAKLQTRTILERRYGTVMLGGGDGTIATTLNLLLEAAERMSWGSQRHSLPDLGILKLGTGNALAHVTGAGRPLDDVARILGGEQPAARPLRLLQCAQSQWVFPFASIGYDAQVLNDYVDLVQSTKGGAAKALAKSLAGYFWAVGTRTIPTELKAKRAHMRIVATGRSSIIDPETKEEIPLQLGTTLFEGTARAVTMGTSPFYGYGMKVLPYAMRRSDRFHLRVSTASITFLLTHLPSLWDGSLKTPDFVDFLVEGVRIESDVPLPMQMAGDAKGHTHELEVRLADRAVRLVDGTGTPRE